MTDTNPYTLRAHFGGTWQPFGSYSAFDSAAAIAAKKAVALGIERFVVLLDGDHFAEINFPIEADS